MEVKYIMETFQIQRRSQAWFSVGIKVNGELGERNFNFLRNHRIKKKLYFIDFSPIPTTLTMANAWAQQKMLKLEKLISYTHCI